MSRTKGCAFRGWADLFAVGPPVLTLTGQFSWTAENAPALPDGYERATQLQGGYDRPEIERDPGGRRFYLLHIGI